MEEANHDKQELMLIDDIQNRIYTIRGVQVMLDNDLAKLYKVETKYLNRAVKRNIQRFPKDFMFQLTREEFDNLKFQSGTSRDDDLRFQNGTSSSEHGGRRYQTYVFTEQGVAMLSTVLRSETAVKMSIQIINAFVTMRQFISSNAQVFQRLDTIELKQLETDKKLETVLTAIESKDILPKQGIFFDGQIFDAYNFVSDLFRSAERSIVIIDNYLDDTVLTHLTKKNENVHVTILTRKISKTLALDIKKFSEQYPTIEIKTFKNAHDRFIIIDNAEIYHFGASLKDLGKKWFAFSKMGIGAVEMLAKVEEEMGGADGFTTEL